MFAVYDTGRNYYECKNPQRAEEVERRESKTNLKHYLERYTAWLEDNTKVGVG